MRVGTLGVFGRIRSGGLAGVRIRRVGWRGEMERRRRVDEFRRPRARIGWCAVRIRGLRGG